MAASIRQSCNGRGRDPVLTVKFSKSPTVAIRAVYAEFAVYTTPNSPTAPAGCRRAGIRASIKHPNPQSSREMASVRNSKQKCSPAVLLLFKLCRSGFPLCCSRPAADPR
jgi:hypothetical protein